jgi:hypothetical protein
MAVLERWNWWLPAPLERALGRRSLEEPVAA